MLVLLIAAAIGACSSTKGVYTPEGSVIYAISCQLQSQDSCMEKAGELCGTLGYRFVLADGSPAPAADRAMAQTGGAPTAPVSPVTGNMLNRKYYVRCHS